MRFAIQHVSRVGVLMVAAALAASVAEAAEDERSPCTEDAMLVFDASGSMSGNGWGYGSENPTAVSRIDKVRHALAEILPRITLAACGAHHLWAWAVPEVQCAARSSTIGECRRPHSRRGQ